MLATTAASTLYAAPRTRMTIQLDCGAIGVKAATPETLGLAQRYGFDSITADSGWLSGLSESDLKRFLDDMKSKGIVWANSGLTVEFRKTDQEFQTGLKALPARAAALQRAGVSRVSTWILPASDTMTFLENLKQHGRRLREIAAVLGDHGCNLGLEYVGPRTSWSTRRFVFVHNMREMRELIAEINKPNVGFLIDSWHWYTAQETVADLLTLKPREIVSVDLNDAPAGLAVEQQKDNMRELPASTGVIPVGEFLNALNKIGCDAPVRCEPFNAPLRAMTQDDALKTTAAAMKKAFALIV